MKLFILSLFFMLPIQWETDFVKAKQKAKENHKLILLNFSGSDWCGPCILFRKDYLEDDGFGQFANDHLVLFNADFPRKKKNLASAEIVKSNEALAEIYNKQGSFPLTLLLNADGKVLKSWQGKPDMTVEKWTAELQSICLSNK